MAKTLVEMAAEIVQAQAGGQPGDEKKAVQGKASIQRDKVICLECGRGVE